MFIKKKESGWIRISPVYGNIDSDSKEFKENDINTMEMDANSVSTVSDI